ncbi:response regulator transcription factor [Maribrevibacterium harenarium]|uniref:Response regulator transcription factor n=1 Tax=Maribrevibacterium harenarium TaxID=2589817 RepID=A0A501WXH6_9GAMM|nr:response regulator transcription factor [Maribrevibacterium harenarium]
MIAISHVLIVEDIPEIRDWLYGRIMDAFTTPTIMSVASLAAAKEAIKQRTWDLVLLDLGLPDGNGTELIRPLKTYSPNCHCIITTIFDDSEHIFPALSAGADGYLLKDEEEGEFCNNLRGILAGRPPLSSSIAQQVLMSLRRPTPPPASSLTPREEEILVLIARGYRCKDAANALGVSYNTACGYLKSVYQKLQINSRAEATLKAIELGIISTTDTP